MDNKKTGEFIASLRKGKKLTQKELADKLFVTDRAVSKWERGIGYPDIKIIAELSKVLEVEINEILYGEKMKNNRLNEMVLKDSITFYQKLQKQSILKKSLIFVPITLVLFFLIIMTFTEITRGVMPFTNGNITMEDWPSFTKYTNQHISKKILSALIEYDYETMEKMIYPSDAKSIYRYIEDFKSLENSGVKFTEFNYTAGSWGELGFVGFYDIEMLLNAEKCSINLGITKINDKIDFGGLSYMIGQGVSSDAFEDIIKAFTIDYENFIN